MKPVAQPAAGELDVCLCVVHVHGESMPLIYERRLSSLQSLKPTAAGLSRTLGSDQAQFKHT